MKKVIVTGANGFIGSSLIKRLISEGVSVVAIDISFANTHLPKSELITLVETTIDDTLITKIPSAEYDAIYHFAWRGVNGVEKAEPTIQTQNIQMSFEIAKAAKELNCKKLLVAGTVAENVVWSLPNIERTGGGMFYGVAKYANHIMLETYCKSIGVSLIWMQFSNIYGVGNRTGNLVSYTLNEILNGNDATFGPAEQPYDFIYIDDLLEAVFRLGDRIVQSGSYFIGSGQPRILKDYLLCIGELANKSQNIRIGERLDDGVQYNFDMFRIDELEQQIGKYYQISFDEGIKKTIEWLQEKHMI